LDRLKIIFAFVLFIANLNQAFSQGNSTLNATAKITMTSEEQVFIHTNTTTLLTGETLHCKLHCIDPFTGKASAISKIAYIELIDTNKNTVLSQKISLKNGAGQTDFFISAALKTGNFKLIGYTQWMLSEPKAEIFQMDLIIINPFLALPENNIDKNIDQIDISNGQREAVKNNLIALEPDKKLYSGREKATIKIKSNAIARGNYSISVRKVDALPLNQNFRTTTFTPVVSENQRSRNSLKILPELRGELLSGSVVNKSNEKNVANIAVALSISGKSFAFKIVKTNASGKFTFVLDDNPDASEIVLQVMEEDRNNYVIAIDPAKKPDLSKISFSSEFQLNSNLKNIIEQRSVYNQVENAYYDRKKDSITILPKKTAFYNSVQKTYALDDYTRFPTLQESITEVILELYTKTSKGKRSIHVRNTTLDPEIYGPPVILVDGLLIQDNNELYDYNTENIDKVDLINEPYIYGPKTFSGVVNFITKNNDYETKASGDYFKKLNIQRPTPEKLYFSPDYSSSHQNSRIPDYRQQLLWMPSVDLSYDEQYVSFFTSDVSGKFEIVLEGFSEMGSPVFVKEIIEVK